MRFTKAFGPILALSLASTGSTQDEDDDSPTFDWNSIKPSLSLEYSPCYGNETQCARLIVPLNYKNPNDTRKVILAVLKYPASVPDDHPTFGGSIFVNPGGPGSSATATVRIGGPKLRERLERSGRRHWEYIGIDPRGVGFTFPPSNCFPNDLFSRQSFTAEFRGLGPLDEGDRTVPYALALQAGFGQHCLRADRSGANGGPIMSYMGTASVARDMVEVADAIQQLRQKRAKSSSTQHHFARVQYMGFSYGTVLGHYFASLFPERVGRLVLDGVVDPQDYSTGPGWTKNVNEVDKIYTNFFIDCHNNPSTCFLSREQDKSGADIKRRFEKWLLALEKAPITSIGITGDVRVLSVYDVRSYLGVAFYYPTKTFKAVAALLDAAMGGNVTGLFNSYFHGITAQHSRKGCVFDTSFGPDGGDGSMHVLCGDGDDVTHKDADWWRRYSKQLVSQSRILGAQWTLIRFRCSAWPFRANWRFTGPFTAPASRTDANGQPVPGYPAAPNLYLSSRLDPVTPLANAREMRRKFPGSGLIILDAMGHTAATSAGDNDCLDSAVEDYLVTGVVPASEKVCQPRKGPWEDEPRNGSSNLGKRYDPQREDYQHPKYHLGMGWMT